MNFKEQNGNYFMAFKDNDDDNNKNNTDNIYIYIYTCLLNFSIYFCVLKGGCFL